MNLLIMKFILETCSTHPVLFWACFITEINSLDGGSPKLPVILTRKAYSFVSQLVVGKFDAVFVFFCLSNCYFFETYSNIKWCTIYRCIKLFDLSKEYVIWIYFIEFYLTQYILITQIPNFNSHLVGALLIL